MKAESNIVLGQRLIGENKIRIHWQMDEEYFPIKPSSKVRLDNSKPLIPVSEKWLKGKKENFEVFTIPYYEFIYMKDLSEPKESYIVQPFSNDLVVIEIEVGEVLDAKQVIQSGEGSFIHLPDGEEGRLKLINDYQVVAGLDFKTKKAYDADKVRDVDLKVGFNEVWEQDLEKIVEAFYYTLSVTENSLKNAFDKIYLEGKGED